MTPRYLDPKWRYVPALETDLKKTFARIRRALALPPPSPPPPVAVFHVKGKKS
ncbi:MAG TPA: hypothetical protein VGM15_03090 [Burkholderiaceae bacterium]|jgi:hypothetical protein